MKAQKVTPIYIMTYDDMEEIGYQVQDVVVEVIEEESQKQDEQHQKLQDLLMMIQQLLDILRIA
jgi:hypothetical protein